MAGEPPLAGYQLTQPPILVVDRNRRNLELLAQFLGQAGYSARLASSTEESYLALEGPDELGLVLVDLAGFDPGVWDLCERVRTKGIPLLIISPKQSTEVEQVSLSHGAYGVLIKPLVIKELLALIRRLVEG